MKLESLSTDVGPASTPRVVVGIPESEPPPGETPAPESVETRTAITPDAPSPITLPSTLVDPTPATPEVAVKENDASETQRESFANTRFASTAELLKKKTPSTPASAKSDDDKNADKDDKTQTFASFASTIAFGSSEKTEKKPEPKEEKDEKTKLFASTVAFGSSVKLDEAAKEAIALAGIDSLPLSSDAPPPSSSLAAKIEPVKVADALKVEPIKVASSPKVEPVKVEPPKPIVEDTVPMKLDKTAPMMGAPKRPVEATSAKDKNKKNAKKNESSRPPPKNSTSVPPVAMDEKDEKFFSEGDLSRHLGPTDAIEANEALTIPDKFKRKSEPAVVLRRQRFVRYVKFAVAGAGILCAAAIARTTMTTSKHHPPAPVAIAAKTAEPTPTPKAAEPAAAPTPAPTDSAAAADPAAAAAAATDPTAANDAKDAAAVAPTEAKPGEETKPAAEEVTGDPKEEKAKMRVALERRKLTDAVAAGEKAVALDPTDGESWLLLGASYQELGKMGEARRCYAACLKEGKTGPRHECMKMLR